MARFGYVTKADGVFFFFAGFFVFVFSDGAFCLDGDKLI